MTERELFSGIWLIW